jgi:membrane-associated phospholipid phosphatase
MVVPASHLRPGVAWTAALVAAISLLAAPRVTADDALRTYGDIAAIALPTLAGAIAVGRQDGEGLAQVAVGTGLTLGTVTALKVGVDSRRPDGGSRSFPSGHAASAFAGASFLHYRYGWQWGLPAYAAASVVAWSRVDADRHYWYDVAAGAAIANVIAYVVTDRLDDDVVIVPVLDLGKHDFGLIARLRF